MFVLDRPVKPPSPTVQSVTTFGVHTGLQNTTIDELRDLWLGVEQLGFDWMSIWDHFYSADLTGYECHEAVAAHAALACSTTSVRVGCLVYCAGYRPAGVLAKAVTTIDHLSGGRAEVGLGAGWAQVEYEALRHPVPAARRPARPARRVRGRASVACSATRPPRWPATTSPSPAPAASPSRCRPTCRSGSAAAASSARCASSPSYADGWNVPFVPPDALAAKRAVLAEHCSALGRDPGEIRLAVNVIVSDDEASFGAQFGPRVDAVRPGAVIGTSTDHVTDALGPLRCRRSRHRQRRPAGTLEPERARPGGDRGRRTALTVSRPRPTDRSRHAHVRRPHRRADRRPRRHGRRPAGPAQPAGGGGVPVLRRRPRGARAVRRAGLPEPVAVAPRRPVRGRALHARPRRHVPVARRGAAPAGSSTCGPSAPPRSAPATTSPTCSCSRTAARRSAPPSPTPTARSTPTTRFPRRR